MTQRKVKDIEKMTEKEKKELAHFLGKKAIKVKAPNNNYLEGNKAIKHKLRGKEIKVKKGHSLFI